VHDDFFALLRADRLRAHLRVFVVLVVEDEHRNHASAVLLVVDKLGPVHRGAWPEAHLRHSLLLCAQGRHHMVDDTRLTELSRRLGIAVAEMEAARRFAEEYGGLSEPYDDTLEGYDDLSGVARALLEAKMKLDFFMDTLPKKQQAIYTQSIEDRKKQQ
jgi:GNAT superfamily N-acetyltransferase